MVSTAKVIVTIVAVIVIATIILTTILMVIASVLLMVWVVRRIVLIMAVLMWKISCPGSIAIIIIISLYNAMSAAIRPVIRIIAMGLRIMDASAE